MKKDYVIVSPEEASVDETAFVENFWTKRWDDKRHLPKAELLPRTEQYHIVQPFLRTLPPHSRILDGGCGMGEWTVFLTNQGFDAVGIDISRRTISRLNELLPGYQFLCGDVRHTNFTDASFDAYFPRGTFENFENGLEQCVNEAHRILKPGGILFGIVPFQNWWHILRDTKALHRWDHTYDRRHRYRQAQRFYQWRLTKPELQRELELRGFRVLQITTVDKRYGVTCWMHANLRSLKKGTKLFSLVRRMLIPIMPAWYISHMILAVAQKVKVE
ncbi:MAG: class I SAM-dependent methyltransferase [Candidatus Binatia bacterium]